MSNTHCVLHKCITINQIFEIAQKYLCHILLSNYLFKNLQNFFVKMYFQIRKFSSFFRISNEVQKALNERKPIVALESTVITHGLPYPKNLKFVFL